MVLDLEVTEGGMSNSHFKLTKTLDVAVVLHCYGVEVVNAATFLYGVC